MTKVEIKEALIEALKEHPCFVFPTEEDRVIARDLVGMGKRIKNAIIAIAITFIVGSAGTVWYVSNLIKEFKVTSNSTYIHK